MSNSQKQDQFKDSESLEDVLREKGLRPTPHRVRIASRVLRQNIHFTADEIYHWTSGLKWRVSRASVYNILNEFVAVGLLNSFHSTTLGRTIYDSNVDSHFHFFDNASEEIFDIHPDLVKIKTTELESLGFTVENVEVIFRGRKTT